MTEGAKQQMKKYLVMVLHFLLQLVLPIMPTASIIIPILGVINKNSEVTLLARSANKWQRQQSNAGQPLETTFYC